MTALIATAAAGALFYLSTNLGTLWPLAWLAPAPVLWYALGGAGARRVLAVAFTAFLLGEVNVAPVYAGLVPAPMLLAALAVPAAAFAAAALSTGRLAQALPPRRGSCSSQPSGPPGSTFFRSSPLTVPFSASPIRKFPSWR